MRKCHRFFIYAVSAVLLILLAGAGYGVLLFRGALPEYAGHAELPGLSAEAHVYRDAYGVPHIFAANMNDAARALGYVHASERMFQMEMQRRAGQGRLSEVVGPSMLGIDKFIRTLGIYHLAESSYPALSPEAQHFFDAYAAGVNDWLAHNKGFGLPVEFTLLGFKPEPWKPADSLVWGKLMALQLSHNYQLEALRGELTKKLTPVQMRGLFPSLGGGPLTIQKAENTDGALPTPLSIGLSVPASPLGKLTGLDHAASNEWVISGSRTESGKPILANDPHLSLGVPILWYLARIVTPELTVKGATVPGLPVVLLGQNNSIAWGMTTTGSDVQDLFIETVDPKNPHNYLTPSGSQPFDTHDEVIHIKGLDDLTLHVRATRHGPVLSDIDHDLSVLAGAGKVLALSFTGLGTRDTSAEALMRINRVTNWTDFLATLKNLYQAPPQNVVYADAKGDIGFINPGLVPVRKKGDGTVPADGASGAYDWAGTVPFDQLPQMHNPSSGVIFNANNALVPDGHKPFLGIDWEEPWRAARLQEFFESDLKQTLDMSSMMQADTLSLAAKKLLPYLVHQKPDDPRSAAALQLLRGWDGTMDKARPEPLIFEAWLYQLHGLLLADKAGQPLLEKGPYAASSIDYILSHKGQGWCAATECDALVIKALVAAVAMLTLRDGADMNSWRWGNEHQALLKNKVLTHIPVLKDYADITLPSSGDFYTLDRGGSFEFDADHPFARTHGGGYRGIYDLADPEHSRFMITTGQSGQVFSPHYGDLAPLWNDVKSITLTGTEAELAGRGLPELVLKP